MKGRQLDITDITTDIEGETSEIFLGRRNILAEGLEEIQTIENIRFPVQVNFHGESAVDFGGPRKEFFGEILKVVKDRFLDGNGVMIEFDEYLARKWYYAVGLIVGLSVVQGGPIATFLVDVLNGDKGQSLDQFKEGLKRTGVLQLYERTRTMRFLFSTPTLSMNANRFLKVFNVGFSEEGTTKRAQEEAAYGFFVRYVRETYAGRRGNVTMEKILRFCTGSEEEPTLGFSMQPTIEFSAIALPMANTCTNKLSLPLTNLNTELFDMAFLSEYFGYQLSFHTLNPAEVTKK
ncbi:uncharacterized protein [Argopecten irradians]|uniref:uncharacterized protein n=1 Tax=Argopecten irradians TaxID=31199 RepID=UPI00371DF76A